METEINCDKKKIIQLLYDKGCIQFGSFKLKSGIESPYYVNLRNIISYPNIIYLLSDLIYQKLNLKSAKMKGNQIKFQHNEDYYICGLPYAGLPYSITISSSFGIPNLLLRKEKKNYGVDNMIEGLRKDDKKRDVIIIDDVLTSGSSIIESLDIFKRYNLNIERIIVLVDRENGGKKRLEDMGLKVESIFKISEIVETLGKDKNEFKIKETLI